MVTFSFAQQFPNSVMARKKPPSFTGPVWTSIHRSTLCSQLPKEGLLTVAAGVMVAWQPAGSEFASRGAQGEGFAEVFRYRVFQ